MAIPQEVLIIDKKLAVLNKMHRNSMHKPDFPIIEKRINEITNELLDKREKLLNHIT
jgi:hypothetical protein